MSEKRKGGTAVVRSTVTGGGRDEISFFDFFQGRRTHSATEMTGNDQCVWKKERPVQLELRGGRGTKKHN